MRSVDDPAVAGRRPVAAVAAWPAPRAADAGLATTGPAAATITAKPPICKNLRRSTAPAPAAVAALVVGLSLMTIPPPRVHRRVRQFYNSEHDEESAVVSPTSTSQASVVDRGRPVTFAQTLD